VCVCVLFLPSKKIEFLLRFTLAAVLISNLGEIKLGILFIFKFFISSNKYADNIPVIIIMTLLPDYSLVET
jgi:hypothetical protein